MDHTSHHAAHHSGHHHGHTPDLDWTAMAAHLELEGETFLPYVSQTAARLADLFHQSAIEPHRILDIGSGPGVATCELARHFPSATVVAVDGSEHLLQRAMARSEGAGLSGRITTLQVDLPGGIEHLGEADLIWMAMVLHHIGDQGAALHRLRALLPTGGMLALAEHGDPLHFLPEAAAPGLTGRLAAADAAWLADMRAGLPHSAPADSYPAMLEAAGFDLLVDQLVHVRLAPPLPVEPRRLLLDRLRRMREQIDAQLDQADRDTLDVLIDEHDPHGIMQRPDVFLDGSRHIYLARAG